MTNERNYGIDLLRIMSMFFVVLFHVLSQGDVLGGVAIFGHQYLVAQLLFTFSYCCVDCYAIISGYVGYSSKHTYSNLVILWLKVVFYCLIITLAFSLFSNIKITSKDWQSAISPVFSAQYWYFTSYMAIFVFFPILGKGIKELSLKQSIISFVFTFILYTVVQHLFKIEVFGTFGGYSPLWLLNLYLLGAIICKLKDKIHISSILLWITYFCVNVINWGIRMIMTYNATTKGSNFYSPMFLSYTSPFVVASAIILLLLFERFTLSYKVTKIIAILSPLTFGVYIIHTHPLIWKYLLLDRFTQYGTKSTLMTALLTILTSLAIFLLCLLCDFIREMIFRLLHIKPFLSKLESKIMK